MNYNLINLSTISDSKLLFSIAYDTFLEVLLLKIIVKQFNLQVLLKQSNELELKLETDIKDLEKNFYLIVLKNFIIRNKPCRVYKMKKSRLKGILAKDTEKHD